MEYSIRNTESDTLTLPHICERDNTYEERRSR